MIEGQVREGLRVITRSTEFTGTVTHVTRSRWRKRLIRFFIEWDHDRGQEAEHWPGDEAYLNLEPRKI